MEYEKNKKYFKVKSYIPAIVSSVIIVVGFLMMAIVKQKLKLPFIVVALVGVVGLIASLTSGMRDEDIDNAVKSVTNRLDEHAAEVFKFPRRYETLHPQVILGGYDYTRGNTPYKRGKDMKYRCAYYCALLLSFTDDGLRALSQKFSVLENDMKEDILYFRWEDVESASHVEHKEPLVMINGKTEDVPYIIFTLKMRDGTTYDYCIRNTADVDDTEDIIRRQYLKVEQGKLRERKDD